MEDFHVHSWLEMVGKWPLISRKFWATAFICQKSIRKQLVIQERGFYVSESAVSYLTLNTFTIFPSMYVVDFNTPFN